MADTIPHRFQIMVEAQPLTDAQIALVEAKLSSTIPQTLTFDDLSEIIDLTQLKFQIQNYASNKTVNLGNSQKSGVVAIVATQDKAS
jgi:hypothetical protein